MKLSKQGLTAAVISLAITVVFVLKFTSAGQDFSPEKIRFKGNPNAEIKIIEFIDFQCPMCARGSLYLGELFKEHGDKLSVTVKYFPLSMHPHAFRASLYAECAARDGQFWPFHDRILQRQDQWKKLLNVESFFTTIAKEIGMDLGKLDKCLASPEIREAVDQDKKEGREQKIRSTPTYYINGKMFVGIKNLKKQLEPLLGIDEQN